MSTQSFYGPRSYLPMSSHAYALSGNPLTVDDVNRRCMVLNQWLTDPGALTQYKPLALAPGLAVLTCQQVIDVLMVWPGPAQREAIMQALCCEFGLGAVEHSAYQVWGCFQHGAPLPMHVYLTCEHWVCDTLPGEPVRRAPNVDGRNPPNWCARYGPARLDETMLSAAPVHALAAGTLAALYAPAQAWRDD